ncbi:Uncharacterised protein [uncultured archaeon]|nr:Uncharacterised protein [uncultured archaeon]
MAADSYNRLPAGLRAPAPDAGSAASSSSIDSFVADSGSSGGASSLPLILSVIALLLGASALYLELTKPVQQAISIEDRAALRSIAANLRSMQQKEFITSSPTLTTNVQVDKSFPLTDILPANFSLPVSADIPITSTVTAISQSGQVTTLRINDTLHIRAQIPVDMTQTDKGTLVTIHQAIPVNTRISGSFKFSNVFPAEFNSMIQTLEQLGAEPKSG